MSAAWEVRNYIDGEWRRPSGDAGGEVLNPATGEVLARAPAGAAGDVAAAVTSPHKRHHWSFTLRRQR